LWIFQEEGTYKLQWVGRLPIAKTTNKASFFCWNAFGKERIVKGEGFWKSFLNYNGFSQVGK